jgi:fumarate reductase flavoprotein subunit
MKLFVNEDCCACSYCYRTCPVGAPYSDGLQTQIDQEKCISCGKCVSVCPMGAIEDAENPPEKMAAHEKISYHCDAVIVGAGASGMTAAVRLAEEGKKVIVLEKEKRTGSGAMHVAGPMQIIDTKWALDAKEKPKAQERIQEVINYSNGRLDEELIKNTVPALPRFFDWLCSFCDASEGFELIDASKKMAPPPMPGEEMQEAVIAGGGMPGSAMGGSKGLVVEAKSYSPDKPMFHNAGEFIMTHLFQHAEEEKVTILRSTRAEHLLKDEDGKILGVSASDEGGEIEVFASVCLIATGSLIWSEALKKVEPDFANVYQPKYGHTIKAYTGDGFEMCKEAEIPVRYEDIYLNITGSLVMPCDGLTVEYAEAAEKKPMIPPDLRSHSNRSESLMVNLKGERFENEQMSCITVKEQMKQPKGLAYALFTEELIKEQPYKWIPVLDENKKPLRTLMPPGMPAGEWNEEHMKWLDSLKGGHLIIAESLEELAERAGMDKQVLKDTVCRYNELCHKKQDLDFGKNPAYLVPLEKGPYYAVRTFLMTDGAEGGIPINEHCQVKGKDGIIANLFAAGDNSSGNIVATEEKERIWITNEFSWALSSGMIAADEMLHQLNEN